METLHYSIDIAAPLDVVWKTMLDDATYREWTGVFHEGSYFVGDWSEGSEIRFLGPNDSDENGSPADGSEGGMIGRIAENRRHEFVSIEYTGFVNSGTDDFDSEFARKVAGAHENYSFSETDGVTTVAVDIESIDEFREMFEESWPPALARLREIAERA